MARISRTLATFCPADILAHNNAISPQAYELFDTFPSELASLERNVATAITALLPDELLVHDSLERTDPESDHQTRV